MNRVRFRLDVGDLATRIYTAMKLVIAPFQGAMKKVILSLNAADLDGVLCTHTYRGLSDLYTIRHHSSSIFEFLMCKSKKEKLRFPPPIRVWKPLNVPID